MELTNIIDNFVDLHLQVVLLRDSSAKTQLDHILREIRQMIDGTIMEGVARLVPNTVAEIKTRIADMQQKIRHTEKIIEVASENVQSEEDRLRLEITETCLDAMRLQLRMLVDAWAEQMTGTELVN